MSEPGMTKEAGETQTAFAVRCIQAQAWFEGWHASTGGVPAVENPYRYAATSAGVGTEAGDE